MGAQRHMRLHVGIKPHKCKLCKKFEHFKRYNVITHLKHSHGVVENPGQHIETDELEVQELNRIVKTQVKEICKDLKFIKKRANMCEAQRHNNVTPTCIASWPYALWTHFI